MSRSPAYVETPAQAQVVSAEGPRPFVTHVRYRLADGRLLDWASRRHRKRPGALGRWIAVLFMIGSACFVAGSTVGYSTLVGARADAVTYFVGSIFFTSAAYLQYVECISADRKALPEADRRQQLLAIEGAPDRLVGDLRAAAWHAVLQRDHVHGARRTPEREAERPGRMDAGCAGSVCFLVASQLAYAEAGTPGGVVAAVGRGSEGSRR